MRLIKPPKIKSQPKRRGPPTQPYQSEGLSKSEGKKMSEYVRLAGQAVLLCRKAVDEWDEDALRLHEVPTDIKDRWLANFIEEARKVVGESSDLSQSQHHAIAE